jgi:hypothetical protein
MVFVRSAMTSRAAVLVACFSMGLMLVIAAKKPPEAKAGSPTAASSTVEPPADEQAKVRRGEYLVHVAGCNDCHTPLKMGQNGPEPDMSRMLSGHPADLIMPPPPTLDPGPWTWGGAATNTAFFGPWGVTYAINLTPEPISGLAIWNEDMFIRAMRTGKHFGESRPIQPPMPWQNYGRMTDEDLKAMFAYLRSIPPVKNEVPAWQPPVKEATPRK